MLFKCLEFRNCLGHKVRITDIPVLLPGDCNYFMVRVRLEVFVNQVFDKKENKETYSFKNYLAAVLKWPAYHKLFSEDLLHNA